MEEPLLESLCMSESSEERATGEMDFVPWGEKRTSEYLESDGINC